MPLLIFHNISPLRASPPAKLPAGKPVFMAELIVREGVLYYKQSATTGPSIILCKSIFPVLSVFYVFAVFCDHLRDPCPPSLWRVRESSLRFFLRMFFIIILCVLA